MVDFDEAARNWDLDRSKVERAECVARTILERVSLPPGASGFEYGCGTGLLGIALAPQLARVVLADNSPGMLDVVREKLARGGLAHVEPLHVDLATDPLPAERFDLVFSLMVLHHVPDTAGILRTFYALLRPGGQVALADLDTEDGSFHGPGVDVHHGFDRGEFGARLAEAGFEEVRIDTVTQVVKDGRAYPVFLATARRPA